MFLLLGKNIQYIASSSEWTEITSKKYGARVYQLIFYNDQKKICW